MNESLARYTTPNPPPPIFRTSSYWSIRPTAPSALAVPADAWSAQDVAKAAYLGLIPDGVTDYDAPLARQDALAMLAKAFCLTPANQSSAPLSAFSDADTLRAENVSAVANLVSRGLVKGFDGALNVNGRVTRAEFVTLLYRIAGSVKDASALAAGEQAAVVRGDAVIKDVNLGRLCVDCSAGSVSLENAQIDVLLVFRSVDVTADASGGVRGAYVLLDGIYMKENR